MTTSYWRGLRVLRPVYSPHALLVREVRALFWYATLRPQPSHWRKDRRAPLLLNWRVKCLIRINLPGSGDSLAGVRVAQDLTSAQTQQVHELLRNYSDIFATEERPIGECTFTEHTIETTTTHPIRTGLRPMPPAHKEIVREEVRKMLDANVIKPSKSPWSSAIVLVKKKDGSTRFCVDYRRLNEVTVKDVFPLPRISDQLESLAGACFFSTLDAASGYWQIPVRQEDQAKTAFITPDGLYEYLKMPFGLCNAPATYQRAMQSILAGLNWVNCLVYIDDILVYSRTFENHLHDLREVFDRLKEANMLLKPSKCKFAMSSVD